MATAQFYRTQAGLLLSWAAAADNPTVKEQLRARAQDYLMKAAQLEQRPEPNGAALPHSGQ